MDDDDEYDAVRSRDIYRWRTGGRGTGAGTSLIRRRAREHRDYSDSLWPRYSPAVLASRLLLIMLWLSYILEGGRCDIRGFNEIRTGTSESVFG